LYRYHAELVEDTAGYEAKHQHRDMILVRDPDLREKDPGQVASAERYLEYHRRAKSDLRAVRARMRELGLIPPELPEELAAIDKGRTHAHE